MEWVSSFSSDNEDAILRTFPLSMVESMHFFKREEVMDAEITYIQFNLKNGDIITERYQDRNKSRWATFEEYVKKWEKII